MASLAPTSSLSSVISYYGLSPESDNKIFKDFSERVESLTAVICSRLNTNRIDIVPQGVCHDRVVVNIGFFSDTRIIERKSADIPLSLISRMQKVFSSIKAYFLDPTLEDAVEELVSLLGQLNQFNANLSDRALPVSTLEDFSLVEPVAQNFYATAVRYYVPRLSLIRSLASFVKGWTKVLVGAKITAVLVLTYFGQFLSFLSSTSNFLKSDSLKDHAMNIGDVDGAIFATSLKVSSVFSFSSTVLSVISEVLEYCSYDTAVSALKKILPLLSVISTAIGLSKSLYQYNRDMKVAQGVFQYTKNDNLDPREKVTASLKHLRQELYLSQEEARYLTEEDIAKQTMKKREVFQRTAGKDCLDLVFANLDRLVESLESESFNFDDAKNLIDSVEEALDKAIFEDQMRILVSIASLVSLFAFYTATGGVPSAVVMINTTINLLIDSGQIKLLNVAVAPAARRIGFRQIPRIHSTSSRRISFEE